LDDIVNAPVPWMVNSYLIEEVPLNNESPIRFSLDERKANILLRRRIAIHFPNEPLCYLITSVPIQDSIPPDLSKNRVHF